jgi:hypothetical protein
MLKPLMCCWLHYTPALCCEQLFCGLCWSMLLLPPSCRLLRPLCREPFCVNRQWCCCCRSAHRRCRLHLRFGVEPVPQQLLLQQ